MELVKKIDSHIHTSRVPGVLRPNGQTFASPEHICKMYDQLGIEKGVLLPGVTPEGTGGLSLSTNEDICEIVSRHPDRFAWFCNVDPRIMNNNENTDFGYAIEHYKKLGAKGVGEITANLPFDDPRVFALFKACERLNMPVVFHIGHTDGDYGLIDELGLPKLEKALKTFPNLIFLGHSQRFWSHISGDVTEETRHGWPETEVKEGGRIVELMRKYPNLHGDLSAGSGANAIMRDSEFGYKFIEEFQDRLHYATDICAPENINSAWIKLGAFLDDAVQNNKISYEAYLKVSRLNTLKIIEG